MNSISLPRRLLAGDLAIPFAAAMVKLFIHLFTNAFAGYGYFRDELYYLACTENLDAGYVDHPPLSIYILAVSRLIVGDSLFALRLLPALAGAATVFLVGLMTKVIGGGRTAQLAACTAALISPAFLAINTFYSMNALDLLFWTLTAYFVMRLLQTGEPRFWLLIGLSVGLGTLNKISIFWLAAALAIGFLLGPQRTWFTTRWPYLAGALVLLLFLPYGIWNLMHDFAHLEFMRNATTWKYESQNPATFLTGQILLNNPVSVPFWFGGLLFLLFHRSMSPFRMLGIGFFIVCLILIVNWHSKPEYLAAAYPPLLAGGGLALEKLFANRSRTFLRHAYIALLMIGGIFIAPVVLPVLPVETYLRYSSTLGISAGTAEGYELNRLPQFYADMFGWDIMAETVAQVYQDLPPEEQGVCAIFGQNYGQAGAIDFFGRKYGLPKALSRHNSYWIWGTRGHTGEVVIIIGGREENHRERFEQVEQAAVIRSDYAIPYENNLPVFVCRKLKEPLDKIWAQIRLFI